MDASGFADFAHINEGDQAAFERLLSQEDVAQFATLTGDNNPVHLDPAFAGRTRFGTPIVHGMLGASLFSTLVGTLLPGAGALLLSQSLEYHAPVKVGDRLTVTGTVQRKSPSQRILVLKTVAANQHGAVVISGESKVQVLEATRGEHMAETKPLVAVVTGASRGIGGAIARKLASDGASVVVSYLNRHDDARQVVDDIATAGGRALAFAGDVTDKDTVEQLFKVAAEAYGPPNVLVNSATGPLPTEEFATLAWSDLSRQLDVHLKGAFLCCQQALPAMSSGAFGRIINVGSLASENVPPTQQTGYVVAKAAVAALTRCIAAEYGPKGITANIVAPGLAETELTAAVPERARLSLKMQTPLRRLATPEDVADAVAFLAGPQARFITGETIHVCGGQVML